MATPQSVAMAAAPAPLVMGNAAGDGGASRINDNNSRVVEANNNPSADRLIDMMSNWTQLMVRGQEKGSNIPYIPPTHIKLFSAADNKDVKPWLASLESHFRAFKLDQSEWVSVVGKKQVPHQKYRTSI